MNEKETFEKLFDSLIDEALEDADRQEEDGLDETEHTFSPQHEAAMARIFRKRKRSASLRRIVPRISVGFAAAILISCVTIMNVEALRIKVLNMIIESRDDHDEVYVGGMDQNDAEGSFNGDTFYLAYIPDGFCLSKEMMNGGTWWMMFEKGAQSFDIIISRAGGTHTIDSEGAQREDVKLKNMEGVYYTSVKRNTMFLCDEKYEYVMNGNIGKDEMEEIMKNIDY